MTSRQLFATTTLLCTLLLSSTDAFVVNNNRQQQHVSSSPLVLWSNSQDRNKSSERAHIERNLEDMMGNDWREFRAKLVVQENAQGGIPIAKGPAPRAAAAEEDAKLAKQGQLGELFAGAISSIFESAAHKKKKQQQQQDKNIFDGDTVGTPATEKVLQSHEDPFLSAEEIPMFLRETKIDKHRWAHEIPHVEPGSLLLANEKLAGVFHQTVVLIIQHCEKNGSIGIVINRPLEGDLLKVATESESCKLDLSLKLAFSSSPVSYGGPVLPEEFSILHGFGEVEGATKLVQGVYVGGSEELMTQVRIQRLNPRNALFVQGHAAWVPGQLSKEIAKGVWYTAAASADLMLRYAGAPVTPDDDDDNNSTKGLWADILTCMGGTYADIARAHSGSGDAPPSSSPPPRMP